MWTVGHACRRRVTNRLITAAEGFVPSIRLGRKRTGQQGLTTEHVQRPIARVVVIAMKLGEFLIAV